VAIGGLCGFAVSPSRNRARLVEKVFVPVAVLSPYLLALVHAAGNGG
jgi:hypothetical protein